MRAQRCFFPRRGFHFHVRGNGAPSKRTVALVPLSSFTGFADPWEMKPGPIDAAR
jgi:hypothetical protein